MDSIETQIDALTRDLELSPAGKVRVLADYHAKHGGKSLLGPLKKSLGMMDVGNMSLTDRLAALTAEKERRLHADPGFAAKANLTRIETLTAELATASAQVIALTGEKVRIAAELGALKLSHDAVVQEFTAYKADFVRKVNAEASSVLASSGHRPLPISGGDVGARPVPSFAGKTNAELTPEEREIRRRETKARALEQTNASLIERGLMTPPPSTDPWNNA